MEDDGRHGRQLSFPQFAREFEGYLGMIHPQLTAKLEGESQGRLPASEVSKCKPKVDEVLPVGWWPISGNDGYLKWLEEQCQVPEDA